MMGAKEEVKSVVLRETNSREEVGVVDRSNKQRTLTQETVLLVPWKQNVMS